MIETYESFAKINHSKNQGFAGIFIVISIMTTSGNLYPLLHPIMTTSGNLSSPRNLSPQTSSPPTGGFAIHPHSNSTTSEKVQLSFSERLTNTFGEGELDFLGGCGIRVRVDGEPAGGGRGGPAQQWGRLRPSSGEDCVPVMIVAQQWGRLRLMD